MILDDPAHLRWLAEQSASLLDFYQPHVCDPDGGYAWLDGAGEAIPAQGHPLWAGSRTLHVFALAQMLGREGAGDVVRHGLDFYLDGPGHDAQYGGWFAQVGGAQPDDTKPLYGLAHVLLAGSTLLQAGYDEGARLIEEASSLIDAHYWREADGLCLESYDRSFTVLDAYRGQNANMHLAEAYLAAYEATGIETYIERATRIATFIAKPAIGPAEAAPWRLPEHYDENWEPVPGYNIDRPKDPFRPYGSLVGHWLEWARLCMQLRGLGVDEEWLIPAATRLFDAALEEGWQPNGGFVYTVDWEGRPVVADRYFWEPAEGVGAACFLGRVTGDRRHAEWYVRIWRYIDEHVVDHERGSWFPELDSENRPLEVTWLGKPDIYHAYQATLYARLPLDQGLAAWAATT